jgi:hypothetical protein
MKASEFRKLIQEEIQNVLTEATATIGRAKNVKLKGDKKGVQISRIDYNDGRISSQIYIFKDEIPDLINFLSKMK